MNNEELQKLKILHPVPKHEYHPYFPEELNLNTNSTTPEYITFFSTYTSFTTSYSDYQITPYVSGVYEQECD